ncbi:hypothetical protein BCJMU51_5467 [Bacillus cereus]|uniref:hypothetical protein n=1 Tax=Bacillus cereus TaxID=1396 RepID=UPI001F18924C|nr:hypothetical protein [Bacillus cereus]BCB40549.1 hypothetical protein BCM0045_5444 [Bacillus cereus]BCC03385.1 hypothetical protein BCM0057_5467 [Bacillus cereus]BCC26904.1 hypothetical protein BCM0079_5497 [Bacillus cereus]BCC38464.1 hypothetical protein BCM0105_5454 [Bacillus cereus]BCC44262.1 hypothetical protein BCJMU01_5429 [Bacillus cereus]
MKELLKEDMDNLFNVGVGNQFDFVGCYKGEKGIYLIDRTDGQTYTDDFLTENTTEAIELLFEKVEEMIDEAYRWLIKRYAELERENPFESREDELREELQDKLQVVVTTALYRIQYKNLKKIITEKQEFELAEILYHRLVEKYELNKEVDLHFNNFK